MLELVYKANLMIDLVNPNNNDSVKIIEMSINRNDIMCKERKNHSWCYSGQE